MINKEKIEEIKKKVHEMNEVLSKLDPAVRSQALEALKPLYFKEKELVEAEEIKFSTNRSFRNDLKKYLKSIADSLYKIEQSLYK